jgi:magnesium chelatase accessory protein
LNLSVGQYTASRMQPLDLWESENPPWPNREMSRMVDAGGIRWHVQLTGCGPSLLLIHGTGASTHTWRDLLPVLAREYTVVAVDLPGHGCTEAATAAQSSIPGMSGSLAALLQALQVSPLYCVGHSAGAVILCRMALDGHIAPRVIVSINGAFVPFAGAAAWFFPPIARCLAGTAFAIRMLARRASNPANVARLIAGTGSQVDGAGIEFYVRLVSNPRHLAGALRMMGNWDLRSFERELPRLTIPLVLLAAENDLAVPPHQADMVQKKVLNAVVRRFPGLGHLAHEEQPLLIAREILKICRDT